MKKEYTTVLKCCQYIAVCSNESIYLVDSSQDLSTLAKLSLKNDNIETVFVKQLPLITDIESTLQNNREVVLLADKTQSLKLIHGSKGKTIESNYNVRSLLILAVHVTLNNNIVLGARSPGDIFPVSGRRIVIVMDIKGKHQTEWEYNKDGKRLFSVPRPSASVTNGNIFVRDVIFGNESGQVKVLSPIGEVLNTYTGHPDINQEQHPFLPKGMTRTQSDNVFVCDMDFFHLLNSDGVPLSYFSTTLLGIKWPHCIAYNTMDMCTMYIRCWVPLESNENAKLYVVEFSELKEEENYTE